MHELPPKIFREVALAVPESLRQLIRLHVERAEYYIEKGKRRGKVLIDPLPLGAVVPAVKYGAGEKIPQRAKRPAQVGVDHARIDDVERRQHDERRRRESQEHDG